MLKLYNDDCLNILKEIDSGTIDCVITSPPYDNLRNYNETLDWNFDIFKNIANELFRVLKQGGVIIWIVNDKTDKGSETGTCFKQALYFKELGLNIHDTMIFRKLNYVPLTHNRYEQEFEYIFCFSKGKPNTFNPIKVPCKWAGTETWGSTSFKKTSNDGQTAVGQKKINDTKIKGNIFEYYTNSLTGGKKYKHPAMFPLDLVKDQVTSWTNEGDIVLDPLMGSGTTGVACKFLNRKFIGIEIVKEYFEMAVKRISECEVGNEQN